MTLQDLSCTPPGNASGPDLPATAEGARYALLQRLIPALQHQVMGNFQSLDMVTVMMERRMESAHPDLPVLRQDCALLASVSQATVSSIINLMGWIRPRAPATVTLDEGVAECVAMLLNEFRFKGFAIVNEVATGEGLLSSQALRTVLSASLMSLSDQSKVPASLLIRAQAQPERIELSIELSPTGQNAKNQHASYYRDLRWQDVQALADAESVGLVRTGNGARLTFNRAATPV